MSIKTKLLGALSLILLVSFLATSMVNYAVTRSAIRDELLNSALPLTGKNIYSEIQASMMKPIMVSSSMATDTFLKSWINNGEKDEAEVVRFLKGINEKYEYLTCFFVSAATDKYYYQGGVLKEINPRDPHDIWYYAFTRSKKEFNLDVDTNEAEGDKMTIFVNFRVEDENGRLLGVAGVGVNLDHMTQMLEMVRKKYEREVYLVDQDGLVQVHPNRKRIERFYITKAGGISTIADKILVERDEALNAEYDWQGNHYLLSAHYIPELKWHLIVEQNEAHAMATARANMIRTLVVGLGSSLLIILLCVGTINHFQSRLEKLALTDHLTGTANRRALEKRFGQDTYKSNRYKLHFSALILDLDHFKEVNDTHGHLMGDKVLKYVASSVQETIRPSDMLARWGGDEFLILLDGTKDDAKALASRIQAVLKDHPFPFPLSISCGVSQYREGDDIDAMTQRADRLLYQSKQDRDEAL